MTGNGKRFNQGKTRHDLTPAFAQEQYARVLTAGANKYGDDNWRQGMSWSKVIASMKRHINAFESGEDFDPETGILHVAHVMCNAAFLAEYYKIFPQGDDRKHRYLSPPRIGLDIDEVIADWTGHWSRRHNRSIPEWWNFDKNIKKKFDELKDDKDFWLTIPVKTSPSDIPFEPCCYITSRNIPQEWTETWIEDMGFPTVPVITVGHNESKKDAAIEMGVDIFVDDRYENFVELHNAGICCLLFDAKHNKRYNVGYKRITSLSEIL